MTRFAAPIADQIWDQKYRFKEFDGTPIDLTVDDTWRRIAKALAAAEKPEDQSHYEQQFYEALEDFKFLPAGRIISGAGTGRDVTLFNCLDGATPILTAEYGLVPIGDVAGEIVTVMDGYGNWTPAPVLQHAEQPVASVLLRGGYNGRELRSIKATAGHRWLLEGVVEKTTNQLVAGDVLLRVKRNDVTDTEAYRAGVRHGIVYGDGSQTKESNALIRLCGEKDHLAPFFENSHWNQISAIEGDVAFYLPRHLDQGLKDLPKNASVSYLTGFLRGWMATDGCVNRYQAMISCGLEEAVWLRKYGAVAGMEVSCACKLTDETNYGKRKKDIYNVHFHRWTMIPEDFLLPKHRASFDTAGYAWKVAEIGEFSEPVPVFCPSVPTTGSMQLDMGIHTGNCFVMGTIPDSMSGIFDMLKEAALTMQQGGGIGYDFSTIRPRGAEVKGVAADASGPLTFMDCWDAMCRTVMSAGSRRGAMMATMRCDHPDIEAFIEAKRDASKLRMFNLSVLVTDAFMEAVKNEEWWPLKFNGQVYREVSAPALWDKIMRSTYDYAEPGVIFIDRINAMNPLNYCEEIASTNPSMPAGTMVHTKDGIVPIESLEGKEFFVKSLDGQWARAKCFLSSDSAEVLEIDFGGGKTVKSTKEHRWPVQVNGRYLKSYASDLRQGDRIPLNLNERLGLNNRGDLDYNDGLVAGIVFGDGSYNVRSDDGRAYMSVHCNKLDADLQKVVAEYFNVSAKPQSDEVVLNITKDAVVRGFVDKVGLTLGDKSRLPHTVWNSNDSFIAGFIDGLFSTDGCISDVSIQNVPITFTNKNAEVCREVALLLAFHGVNSNIRSSETEAFGSTFERTDVTIAHGNAIRFAKLFHLTCSRKQDRLYDHLKSEKRDHVSSSHQVVKSVKSAGEHRVWDISVYHDQHVFPSEWCYTGNCGEQPLPPYGACLLGSINLTRLIAHPFTDKAFLKQQHLADLVHTAVRMLDNVIDISNFPLPQQAAEAHNKRRIGLGVTGLADALLMLGITYGSDDAVRFTNDVMSAIAREAYRESARLAQEKGAFPLFDRDAYLAHPYIQQFDEQTRDSISAYGLRNSHLTSIAPTGTISLLAGNVSSGIEPVFAYHYTRKVLQNDGSKTEEEVEDYAYGMYRRIHTDRGEMLPDYFVSAQTLDPAAHVRMQAAAQKWVDSSISKTVNCPEDISFEDFKAVYQMAYDMGCKGCTTYRPNDVTGSVLSVEPAKPVTASMEEAQSLEDPRPGAETWADTHARMQTATLAERPENLHGNTYKLKWPGSAHAIYVTINDDEHDNPFEIFINSKDTEHFSWTVALTRMVSAVFRRGGDVRFVSEELKAVFDPRGGAWVGGKYIPSVLAAIGGIIERHMDNKVMRVHVGGVVRGNEQEPLMGEQPSGAVAPMSSKPCPKCGSYSTKNESGCFQCLECGESKCG